MSSELKNVIIIGAGGNLGPAILKALLNSPFNVTILSRQESTSTFPSEVKVIKADYTSAESLKNAFQGQDVVVSLVGGMALGDQQNFIDAAIASGVKRFLPSEYGIDTTNPRVTEIAHFMKAKTATVDYLKTKESQISWTVVQTGLFFDWCLRIGLVGFDLANKTATLIDEGTANFTGTNFYQVGEAVAKILANPAETKNQYVRVSSVTVSQAGLLKDIERITGEKFIVTNITAADLKKEADEKLQKGDMSGVLDQIKVCVCGKDSLADLNPLGLWNDKLGLEKHDLEATLRAVIGGKLVGE